MIKLWMDLELRADIDDFITLLIALESNEVEIKVISIDNPSLNEMNLLGTICNKYLTNGKIDYLPTFLINGQITKYEENKDIHKSLKSLLKKGLEYNTVIADDYIKINNCSFLKELTYFTGGSLRTLSKLIKKVPTLKAHIQGGYASPSILEEKDVLKKFQDREEVPSWNLNLDIESTRRVMNAYQPNLSFISKNICHSSFVSMDMLENKTSFIYEVLNNYFKDNNGYKKKCMYDVLAFFTILYSNLVEFKKVNLLEIKKDKRSFWYSVLNESSNKKISVSYDYEEFLKIFNSY